MRAYLKLGFGPRTRFGSHTHSDTPPPQELASAERVKRQAQQERDELQDEINNQAAKK